MNFNKITKYNKCDILKHNNDIESHGFDKTITLGEMIDKAINNNCRIIIKNGFNGKWYLKGQHGNIASLREKINNRNLSLSRDGVYCILLEE